MQVLYHVTLHNDRGSRCFYLKEEKFIEMFCGLKENYTHAVVREIVRQEDGSPFHTGHKWIIRLSTSFGAVP